MHSVDELWQEYDQTGVPIMNGGAGVGDDGRHSDSKYYGVSAVWLYRRTEQGLEILYQKRSDKVDNGGKYDISAGGHHNYGETPIEGAVRECREEIGAVIDPTKLVLELSLNTGYNLLHLYSYDWTGQPDNFHFDDNEVSEVRWVPLSDLKFREQFVKEPIKNIDIYFDVLKRRA